MYKYEITNTKTQQCFSLLSLEDAKAHLNLSLREAYEAFEQGLTVVGRRGIVYQCKKVEQV
jgi:hypothetical protein